MVLYELTDGGLAGYFDMLRTAFGFGTDQVARMRVWLLWCAAFLESVEEAGLHLVRHCLCDESSALRGSDSLKQNNQPSGRFAAKSFGQLSRAQTRFDPHGSAHIAERRYVLGD